MEQDCFSYELEAHTFKPSAEIEEIKWFSKDEYLSQAVLVPSLLKLFDYLESVSNIIRLILIYFVAISFVQMPDQESKW